MTFQVALGVLLIALTLFWAGLLLWTQPRRTKLPRTPARHIPVRPSGNSGEEQLWRGKLLSVTRGNVGAIERGLAAKRRRFPHLPESELLHLLYEEYLRDRR